jgi:hypothetical protein
MLCKVVSENKSKHMYFRIRTFGEKKLWKLIFINGNVFFIFEAAVGEISDMT